MKKITMSLALFLTSTICFTQKGYVFDVYESNYEEIENGIVVTDSLEGWGGDSYPVDLGFSFMYNNQTYSSVENIFAELYFEEESNIIRGYVGGGIEGQNAVLNNDSTGVVFNQPITYLTIGDIGSRIYKVEYKNANSFSDECLSNGDSDGCKYTNFQYWLYEGSNIIEIHYGPNNFLQSFFNEQGLKGPIVTLQFGDDEDEDLLVLSGDPLSPSIITDSLDVIDSLGIWPSPAEGTVYRFTPDSTVSIDSPVTDVFNIYPSPVNDYIYIERNDLEFDRVVLTDLAGIVVLIKEEETNEISVIDLKPGLYFILLYRGEIQVGVQKIIKQ